MENINCHQKEIRLTIGQEPLPIEQPEKFIEIKQLKDFSFGKPSFYDAKRFIEKYEWLGYVGRGRITFAIWKNDALYGVEVFGPLPFLAARVFPDSVQSKITYLSRGACCLEAGPNAGSMLIGASLRELRKDGYWLVVSYSDTSAGEDGCLYRAANFKFAGWSTSKGTQYVKISGKWYAPKSLYNSFGISDYKRLDDSIKIEETQTDKSNKKRWAFVLNKKVLEHIPYTWNFGKD